MPNDSVNTTPLSATCDFLELVDQDADGNPIVQIEIDPDNPEDGWVVGLGGGRVRHSEFKQAIVLLQLIVAQS